MENFIFYPVIRTLDKEVHRKIWITNKLEEGEGIAKINPVAAL